MQNNKEKPVNLRIRYKRTLEMSFVIALLILCSMFFAFQKHESSFELPVVTINDIIIEVIPPTVQQPPKPPIPPIPTTFIPDDSEIEMEPNEILARIDFDPTEQLGLPPEEEIEHIFNTWELSKEPKLKYKAIPVYPEIARKAGIEGLVSIEVVISKKGDVIKTTILKGIPMLNEAALDAAQRCTFFPAMQRDKYVKVRMSIPFDFRLK